ncbi:hypothetical protein BDAP_002195 [Binucleata daphniae]
MTSIIVAKEVMEITKIPKTIFIGNSDKRLTVTLEPKAKVEITPKSPDSTIENAQVPSSSGDNGQTSMGIADTSTYGTPEIQYNKFTSPDSTYTGQEHTDLIYSYQPPYYEGTPTTSQFIQPSTELMYADHDGAFVTQSNAFTSPNSTQKSHDGAFVTQSNAFTSPNSTQTNNDRTRPFSLFQLENHEGTPTTSHHTFLFDDTMFTDINGTSTTITNTEENQQYAQTSSNSTTTCQNFIQTNYDGTRTFSLYPLENYIGTPTTLHHTFLFDDTMFTGINGTPTGVINTVEYTDLIPISQHMLFESQGDPNLKQNNANITHDDKFANTFTQMEHNNQEEPLFLPELSAEDVQSVLYHC